MKPRRKTPGREFGLLIILFALVGADRAVAHIGSPAAVYESSAGPYAVRVIVLPAPVIPGRAEINVRLLKDPGGPVTVSVLPVNWRAGLKGAPPPDVAEPVAGEPLLRHSELWLMTAGSYSVHVNVSGAKGAGTVIVPVSAVATSTLRMTPALGVPLGALGLILFVGAVALVAFGARDAVRPADAPLGPRQRRLGYVSAAIATLMFGACVYGGAKWWTGVDEEYRSNQVYRPTPIVADVSVASRGAAVARVLTLWVAPSRVDGDAPLMLIPDHGKLMHLFAIREPQLDALAHLHPIRVDGRTFAVTLPPLPAGTYRLYADITNETGFASTLTTSVRIEATPLSAEDATGTAPPIDPDDSSLIPNATGPTSGSGAHLVLQPQHFRAHEDTTLSFILESRDGRPLAAEPYMGMLGHAAIRRDDGSVFAHVHPTGTISMAAQAYFIAQASGAPLAAHAHHHPGPAAGAAPAPITFPYLFPQPGQYRVWVQTKYAGEVITTPVDVTVADAGS